ncbi:hypothetical protein ACH35V_07910 [Actinomadura sp. 1N219]
MSNPLANPRRTKVVEWPERLPEDAESERPAESEANEDATR